MSVCVFLDGLGVMYLAIFFGLVDILPLHASRRSSCHSSPAFPCQTVLDHMPPGSLLLSHTDLTWNPVRYLQACEGLRPDVTHLSLQLLP
jgi:hypothetical protein